MASSLGSLTRALDQWVDGPAALVAERWQSLGPGGRVAVSLSADGRTLRASPRKRGAAREFVIAEDGGLPLESAKAMQQLMAGRGVALSVPASFVILRKVSLPLEAAPHLDGIAAARVSSLSPLPASETIHGHRVLEVNRDARRMDVAIAIVPRVRVAAALSALDAAAARDVRIEAPIGEQGSISLDPRGARRTAGRGRIKAAFALLLIASLTGAVAALAGGAYLGAQQAEARAALERRAEAARAAISAATSPEVADTAPKQAALDIKDGSISVVGALEDFAAALPQHSFATEISFADGMLRLTGRTRDLPDALTALESSGRFADSRPVGALTHEEGGVYADFVLETRPLIRSGGALR